MPAAQGAQRRATGTQRGFVLLAISALLVFLALGLFVNRLNANSLRADRDKLTERALADAKEALMGYAVRRGDVTGTARPGDLPCPDTDGDGLAQSSCGAAALGLLPYRTLGIEPARDGYGEPLWYALSPTFRQRPANALAINSDTPGSLTIYGANGGTQIATAAALLLAPGPVLITEAGYTQVRGGAPLAANYLESANGRSNATAGGPFIAGAPSATFNDRVLAIETRDIIPLLERRVVATLRPALLAYRTANAGFPHPARHDTPGCMDATPTTDCLSDNTVCRGRLPGNSATGTGPWGGTAVLPDWFNDNRWNEVLYYAVGTASLPGAPALADCTPTLTLDAAAFSAIVMTPGIPANGVARPSNLLSAYLEDAANQDGWTNALAGGTHVTPTAASNDHVIALP